MTGRPVAIDLTYVAARLHAPTPTGIERVDAAFAQHFANRPCAAPGDAVAVHYGLRRPHLLGPEAARRLVARAATAWHPAPDNDDDPVEAALRRWLRGPPQPFVPMSGAKRRRSGHAWERLRWHLADDRATALPRGAIYLNVAQYAFEYPAFLRWLENRTDMVPVFFIHDLLPLDYPEFFREGYGALFERRVATMARFAGAGIVSNAVVAARVAAEMARRGRDRFPLCALPLPPPAPPGEAAAPDPDAAPYCLVVGTIEPRKNHLLLLHAWRSLAEGGGPTIPRLVIVGPRGWDNEQVVDLLDRSTLLRPHVAEVSGLGTPALSRLIAGARAVLAPSFAEGYGLPLAEALAAGAPAIASDIPVFRAVSQGRALLLDPTDGPAWRQAILDVTADPSPSRDQALAEARRYRAPTWPDYFAAIEGFLATL